MTCELRSNDTKLALIVSDLHVGSSVGLLPEGFVTHNGNEIRQNKLQRWLWSKWLEGQEWAQQIIGNDPFVLITNGDLIEGVHHRTKEIWSVNEVDHIDAAQLALKPLTDRAKDTYVIYGTEVHVKDYEDKFAEAVGAVRDEEAEKACFLRLELDINGCLLFGSHHITTTSRVYLEASQLSIALGNVQLEYARVGKRIPDFVFFGHRHRAGYYSDGTGACMVSGAWQFLTRHGGKVVPGAQLKPSIQVLDWRGVSYGDLPVVHQKVFTPEKQPILKA